MASSPFMEQILGSTATQISSSLTLFATFALLFLYLSSLIKERRCKLPPGPRKLPIIGNMHYMLCLHPFRALRDLAHRHGPLMHLQIGRVTTIVASDARLAKEIMKTQDSVFGTRPVTTAAMVLTYGCRDVGFSPSNSHWKQARKICVRELLSPKRVQSFGSIREEEVLKMVRDIFSAAPGPVNLTRKLLSLANDITARVCFGKKCAQQERFLVALSDELELLGGVSVGDFLPWLGFVDVISGRKSKMEKASRQLDRVLDAIVEEHRKEEKREEKEEDLVDVLLRLQKDGGLEVPLTTDHVKGIIWDMFAGGTETSSTTIEWALAELMRNPRLMEKAQKEVREVLGGKSKVEECDINKLTYLKMVIKETLRLHPPAPLLLPREAMEECIIEGYEIPAKSTIIVNAWAISRSQENWERPENFEPERFSDGMVDFKGQHFELTPFGAGRRGCPGIWFGLSTTELTLTILLLYFDWALPNGMKAEDLDMTEGSGLTIGRKMNLNLIPIPRIPLLA